MAMNKLLRMLYLFFLCMTGNNIIAYTVIGTQNNGYEDFNSLIVILIVIITYAIISWQILRYMYRKEKHVELAAFVLKHKKLPLTPFQASSHFIIPGVLLSGSIISLFWNVIANRSLDDFFPPPEIIAFLFILFIISYLKRKQMLRFECVKTTLNETVIREIFREVASKNKWGIEHDGDGYIMADNWRDFRSSRGEEIYLVFDKGQVWINCVHRLDQSLISFGYTSENIELQKQAMEEYNAENKKKAD